VAVPGTGAPRRFGLSGFRTEVIEDLLDHHRIFGASNDLRGPTTDRADRAGPISSSVCAFLQMRISSVIREE